MEDDKSEHMNTKNTIGESVTTSCERCRRRKIKCDRREPCAKCRKAGTDCIRGGTGEKSRPVLKSYVQALEGRVASLELFLGKLATVDEARRTDMLAHFRTDSDAALSAVPPEIEPDASKSTASPSDGSQADCELPLTRTRTGQMRRQPASHSSKFYGGTSLFQIHLPVDSSPLATDVAIDSLLDTSFSVPSDPYTSSEGPGSHTSLLQYLPHDDTSQRMMAAFFRYQYQHAMCVYREYFLRDYDTGSGRYYSEVLLYAICAMGALATGNKADAQLSSVFAAQAEALLHPALDNPDLTVLQALVLLGQREISHCHASRGWLYCGMAFRLAHEMGLHLDPNNWHGTSEPDVDREVLRRVYWSSFILDRQLSLYFGRPPALYPHHSDVRNTVRLPYPPDWEGLLDTYIAPGMSATAYEDGIAFVGSFIYQAELSKIQHNIITDLFENRRLKEDNATVAATVQRLHLSLTKWLASLPGKLYWNQWTVGAVPASVLQLHMRFHTTMIILHRPPPHLFAEAGIAANEDVEVCYESLQAISRLLKSYSRFYRYDHLPLDFVHTLSTVASTLFMKHHLDKMPWDDGQMSRSLALVLEAMNDIKDAHPCVLEIKRSIVQATQTNSLDTSLDTGLAADLGLMDWSFAGVREDDDLPKDDWGAILTDEILGEWHQLIRVWVMMSKGASIAFSESCRVASYASSKKTTRNLRQTLRIWLKFE